jgi:hypothetical protein
MSACNFDRLLQFVNKQLDLDGQLEVYYHLDRCDICRDAVYEVSRDRDEAFLIYRAHRVKPSFLQHSMDAAGGLASAAYLQIAKNSKNATDYTD